MSRTRKQTDIEISTYNKKFFDTYIDLLPIVISWYTDEVWKFYTSEGVKNWQQFCKSKLSVDIPRLNRDERKKIVNKLNESGLSTRAIGYLLNIGKTTVEDDLKDISGRNRPLSNKVPAQELEVVDLVQIDPIKKEPIQDRKPLEIPEPIKDHESTKDHEFIARPIDDEDQGHLELLAKQTKIVKHFAHIDSLLFDIRKLLNSLANRSDDFAKVLREYADKIEKELKMTRLAIDMTDMNIDDEIDKILNRGPS